MLAGAVLATANLAAQQNIVVNPGFEDGPQFDAPPWGVGGWRGSVRATTAEKHSGRRSLFVEGGGDEGGINSAMQLIPIDPTGQTKYHYRFWIKFPNASAANGLVGRTRWYFDGGANGGQRTTINDTNWTQIDDGGQDLIPAPGDQKIALRFYTYGNHEVAYVDDFELVGEATGTPSYPGITGVVKDAAGQPVAGAVVFLNSNAKAQLFANSSAVTDSTGHYTVCVKDDGDYYAVAWKAGYNLSAESKVSLAAGSLNTLNPTIAPGSGGRDLAISTADRTTTAAGIEPGTLHEPQFSPQYLFDGNAISTRYYNNVAGDRWVYVDLDPVGKQTFAIRELVLHGLGVTLGTEGWPGGPGDVLPKAFTIEYTTGDPATEADWSSKVAFSATDVAPTLAPIVIRLDSPITARAIRLHGTEGGFGPTELEVNSDTLPRGTVTGVVKDSTGAPVAGARVVVWRPTKVQSDEDIYGAGNPVPFVVAQEELNQSYDIPVAKSIEQTYITDAQGRYTFAVHPGRAIRISALASGYAYGSASVTPPANGAAVAKDLTIGKSVVISGVIKNASGPLANALIQVGPADSKYVAITGPDGKYNVGVGAGTYELYADAAGYAANTQSVTLTTDTTKDITLAAATESTGLNANFDANITGWEIQNYNTNWVALGTSVAATRDTTQNNTPGGSGSAVVEDKIITDTDGVTELPVAFRVLQRTAAGRIAVDASKAYNVYFKIKAENWVTPEHRDAVLYRLVWRNAGGTTVGVIHSYPSFLYPQPTWSSCERGVPEGTDDSISLARLSPPPGATTLDVQIGWVRTQSEINPDSMVNANPDGSLLYVDDLVVDAVATTSAPATISISRDNAGIKITYDGTLESTADLGGTWTAVPAATSPFTVTGANAHAFYRARR